LDSPDKHSSGFLETAPSAMRYDTQSLDPDNVALKLANLLSPNSRVLDVGCGTGSVTEIIQTATKVSIIGIEPDAERVQRALARGLNVHQGFLTAEFVREYGPFDHVVFADVLEHLADPADAVVIAKQGLKPGGSIVVSVPNVAHWFVRLDLLIGRFDYQDCGIMDATHLRWFTRRTIREFFERLGFEISAMSHTVNIELPDFSRRLPWRCVPRSVRKKIVRPLAAVWPGLFGCQHIVRATLPG
jgi:methionine biosynthesis protein MetW